MGRGASHASHLRMTELAVVASLAVVGWAKARKRRAHHSRTYRESGGHASLCPPYKFYASNDEFVDRSRASVSVVMPGLDPGIHVFLSAR
ncbi:hypothetical protein SAMN05192541_116158 [Bradyrhizobium arachidis]|nr:hypothetical protein SAMN05192541_116158 [Bradyrhizobium arachidis]